MVMGYQAYAGNGLLDGITTGVGLRQKYDDMKRQQQLQERSDNFGTALSNYYSAQDDAGRQAALQEMAKNDPASTLTFQKNNKDSSFGVGTAKGEYLQIQALLNDPLTPEPMKESLKRRASVLEKIPDIEYSNAFAGRMGTLQADLGLGGQVEAEKVLGREKAQATVDNLKNKREAMIREASIQNTYDWIKEQPDYLFRPQSEALSKVGSATGGAIGYSDEEQAIRGEINRRIGTIQNDLVAEARAKGQTGINTLAERLQAVKGIDENSGKPALLKALEYMIETQKILRELPDDPYSTQMSFPDSKQTQQTEKVSLEDKYGLER